MNTSPENQSLPVEEESPRQEEKNFTVKALPSKSRRSQVRFEIALSRDRCVKIAQLAHLPGVSPDAIKSIIRAALSKMSDKSIAEQIGSLMGRKAIEEEKAGTARDT